MAQSEEHGFRPPYPPFKTFTNFLEGLEEKREQFPPRIDRSYLRGLSGVSQSQLLATLRAFELIDDEGRVTPALKELAISPEQRPRLIGELVHRYYPKAVELGRNNATQQMLEDEFAEYGLTGSTRRKAVSFFLKASEWGEVPLSPHFSTPKVASSGGGRRKRRPKENAGTVDQNGAAARTAPSDARERYIDLLLKKAEDDMDDKLLDRIERVIGVEAAAASEENRD